MLIREKYVSLHPLKRNNGRVAQLNRVADYGSAGYRFESCRGHSKKITINGRVAQLNRVADYGSAGYRFESCRDHQNPLHFLWRILFFTPFHRRNPASRERKLNGRFTTNDCNFCINQAIVLSKSSGHFGPVRYFTSNDRIIMYNQ